MAFTTRLKVRFSDEDHAGVVYFPRYLHFFHCVFEDFFDTEGFPYHACLDVDRIGWPAVRVESDFREPLRFGDTLEVRLSVARIGERSATFRYEGRAAGSERIAVEARITVACVDMDAFRAVPIPPKYRALFERHLDPRG